MIQLLSADLYLSCYNKAWTLLMAWGRVLCICETTCFPANWVELMHLDSLPKHDIINVNGGKKTPKYDTRQKATPNVQKHAGLQFNNSYMCKSITEYNKLSMNLKSISNSKPFIRQLKMNLLDET